MFSKYFTRKNRFKVFIILSYVLLVANVNADDFWGNTFETCTRAGEYLEDTYREITRPIRETANEVYEKTIRNDYNKAKNEFKELIPDQLEFIYKDVIERRIKPVSDFQWNSITGKEGFSTSTQVMINEYVKQAKEFTLGLDVYIHYQSLKAISSPLPQEMMDDIEKHWGKVTSRKLQKEARYITSSQTVDMLTLGNASAITFYDVIIFRHPLSNTIPSTALLAHELIHVDQYNNLGFQGFATNYYIGGKFQFDEDNKMEKEAYGVGDKIKLLLEDDQKLNTYHNTPQRNIQTWSQMNSISRLARLESIIPDTNYSLIFTFISAISNQNKCEILELANYALVNPENKLKPATQAVICRIIASDQCSQFFSPAEQFMWAKLAIQYNQHQPIDWKTLAKRANQCFDILTEYRAHLMFASICINEEIKSDSSGKMTPRLINASNALKIASNLGEQIQWKNVLLNNRLLFDNRLPHLMQAKIGFQLNPSYSTLQKILKCTNRAIQIDIKIRIFDVYHFQLLDMHSLVHLKIGQEKLSRNHMEECIRWSNIACNHFNSLNKNVRGVRPSYYDMMRDRSRFAQDELRGQK